MAHTFANLLTQVIFSTKNRQPLLTPDLRTAVVNYIRNQDQHHRKISFQEEFIAFLKAHGIAYDERYIWG